MPETPAQDDVDRARNLGARTGRRIATLAVITVAVLFIGASTWQVVSALFGLDVRPMPDGPPGSAPRTCAEGVRALSLAAEPPASSWDTGGSLYRACAATPRGLDTWAALLRLRMAREQLPHAGPAELDPLRRDVWAHLPTDLR
jgi:hypothetical protein